MSTHTLQLEGMEFYAYHGCYDLEKVIGSRFRVDLTLEADLSEAARTDDISQKVNYVKIFEIVRTQMEEKSDLIEHVAQRISRAVRQAFPQIVHLTVKVSKLAPPLGGKLGCVSITLSD